jgi:hypothetical protein
MGARLELAGAGGRGGAASSRSGGSNSGYVLVLLWRPCAVSVAVWP